MSTTTATTSTTKATVAERIALLESLTEHRPTVRIIGGGVASTMPGGFLPGDVLALSEGGWPLTGAHGAKKVAAEATVIGLTKGTEQSHTWVVETDKGTFTMNSRHAVHLLAVAGERPAVEAQASADLAALATEVAADLAATKGAKKARKPLTNGKKRTPNTPAKALAPKGKKAKATPAPAPEAAKPKNTTRAQVVAAHGAEAADRYTAGWFFSMDGFNPERPAVADDPKRGGNEHWQAGYADHQAQAAKWSSLLNA